MKKIALFSILMSFMLPVLAMDAPSTFELDCWNERLRLGKDFRIIQRHLLDQLYIAIGNEDYESTEQLLARGVNAKIQPNLTLVLLLATRKGSLNLCQLLIEYGADPIAGPTGSPIHEAVTTNNIEIFKLFMSVIDFIEPLRWNKVQLFNPSLDDTILAAPKRHEMDFDMANSLLCSAVSQNRVEICNLLIDAGANIEAKYSSSADATPLLCAAQNGHEEVCSLLLNAGANIDAENHFGHNAFIRAKNSAIRKLLVAHATKGNLDNRLVWAAQHYNGHRLSHAICKSLMNDQAEINDRMKTTLLCLNHMRNSGDECARLLYRQFNSLLRPYLEEYIPLKRLIDARDTLGRQAYDYLKIDCLKPEEPGLLEKCVVL